MVDASTEDTIATYTDDHLNRRVSTTDASGTVQFHYDGASPDVIAETDEAGDVIASYLRDGSGRLVAMERGGQRYYYHANARGDVAALSDGDGDVVNSYRYDPWGRVLEADETVENPYRYAGYRYDEGTGLYQLWNRYYDPTTARFITKDIYPGELESPGTMNGYAYCLGDPVNAVDPSGLMGEYMEWFTVGGATFSGGGIAILGSLYSWPLLVGAAVAVAAALAAIETGADWSAYGSVHDDFVRLRQTCQEGKDRALATSPDGPEYQMWVDIEQAVKDDQKAVAGPLLWDLFELGTGVSAGG